MGSQTRVSDIISTTERLAGEPMRKDEGVQLGPPEREVRRALLCWMATRDALLDAEQRKADLVIAHESLFYPYNARVEPGQTQPWEAWPTNRRRREIIERANMTVMRIHGSADRICIAEVFCSMLDLANPVGGGRYRNIFEIEPLPFRHLLARVKAAVGMEHVRVSCAESDFDKQVHRIGVVFGGLGLYTNVGAQEAAIESGCDALIAGESDSYGFRFSAECGIPMIETTHEASEEPGFRRFMQILAEHHADVEFSYHVNGNPWRWA